MSKSEGRKIALKFTDTVVGDLALLRHLPLGATGTPIKVNGYPSHSSIYDSRYPSVRAFDGNTNTEWYTRNSPPQWVRNRLLRPTYAAGFRWYVSGSHKPNDFYVEGTMDGVNWDLLYEGNSPNVNGWHEFYFPQGDYYNEYRWTITRYHGSYVQIYEIELIEKTDFAIDVTGFQRFLAFSESELTRYPIVGIEKHPVAENTILLTFHEDFTFRNVDGPLTVKYDASKGNLIGFGGAVENFEVSFQPIDLVRRPKPHVVETIIVTQQSQVDLVKMSYHNRFSEHGTLTISFAEATVELIYISIENP